MEGCSMNEKTKFRLEICSLLLSLFAIIISIVSFVYTVYKDSLESTEQISIVNAGYGYDEFMIYNSAGEYRGQGMINGVNYSIIVSNNSRQRVSLISYDIFRETESSKFRYKNMIEQIKDASNQEVFFPISIDSGESVSLTFELNTLIPASVNMLLLDKYGTEAQISFEELRDYLGEKKCDIFGNEVDYTKYGDGNYRIEIDSPHYPVYSLEIITSRGMMFETVLTQGMAG